MIRFEDKLNSTFSTMYAKDKAKFPPSTSTHVNRPRVSVSEMSLILGRESRRSVCNQLWRTCAQVSDCKCRDSSDLHLIFVDKEKLWFMISFTRVDSKGVLSIWRKSADLNSKMVQLLRGNFVWAIVHPYASVWFFQFIKYFVTHCIYSIVLLYIKFNHPLGKLWKLRLWFFETSIWRIP